MSKGIYKISQTDKIAYYDYIVKFENELSHFVYDWHAQSIQDFLVEHQISSSEGSGKFWIHLVAGHKQRDKAYSILKRIRNSMAHGNIQKGKKYYCIKDFTNSGNKTMDCQIPVKVLWRLIELIIETRISSINSEL
ncbi:MAG: hypothetical protein LIO90_05660 [Bacteroidales bacterium]|nr:hypothetical protein [Bacteroidales bacterium]